MAGHLHYCIDFGPFARTPPPRHTPSLHISQPDRPYLLSCATEKRYFTSWRHHRINISASSLSSVHIFHPSTTMPQRDPETGCVVPDTGEWPAPPQEDVPIKEDRLWIDGCFDFFHHGHAGVMLQ
ncbi:unnamed protein product [Cercospora beticola]|nr:unnamed protein product [Cercospora beticola]